MYESGIIVIASIIEILVIIWVLSQVNRSVREEIEDLEVIYYNGIAINIPSKTEVILERLYGDTWNIPDPNYQFD